MGNLLGILVLGVEYSLIVFPVYLYFGARFPLTAAIMIFVVLATIALVLWNEKEFQEPIREWKRYTLSSIGLGVLFFGADMAVAFAGGHTDPFHFPGGLLGLPVTFAICPGATIICLAGLVRAVCSRWKRGQANPPFA